MSDIMEYQPKQQYDMVISQAVLRHVDNGEVFLRRMVSFVKKEGLFVSIECNREFEADGLYIQGMEYDKLCQYDGLEKMWKTELKQQNRDYSIAMKKGCGGLLQAAKWDCQVSEAECRKSSADENDGIDDIL